MGTHYPLAVADDWRVRVELADDDARREFTGLLQDGLSPLGTDLAQTLQGGHVSISGDDENLFVYADSPQQAENAHAVILAELEHHAIVATTSGVEHWLADEERWDNEPAGETWEEEVTEKGYAPWEVRVDVSARATRRSAWRRRSRARDTEPDPPVVAPDRRRHHPRGRRRARSATRTARSSPAAPSCGRKRSTPRSCGRSSSSAEAGLDRRPWRTISTHSSSTFSPRSWRSSRRTRPARSQPAAEALWQAQIASRHCDLAARWLQKEGRSFYTIGSAGHESNAAVALALRPTDPALLHYRSGAFYLARAAQVGHDGVPDIMLGRHRCDRRADRGRAPQGLRPSRPCRDPADVDDRIPPAPGSRRRDRDRSRAQARRRVRLAERRGRRVQLRRRVAQPRDGAGCAEHDGACGAPAPARAPALRLRGQRSRDQRSVSRGVGCRDAVEPSRPPVRGSRRQRSRGHARDGAGARRLGARAPTPGGSPPPDRPLPRPRGRRRRGGLPLASAMFAPISTATRCSRRRRWLVATGARTGSELADEYLASRARVREVALDAARRPQLASAADVMRPLASHSPDAVAELARGTAVRRGAPDACSRDQRRARRCPRATPRDAPLRRGRRSEGRRLRRHARPACALRCRPRLRHAARRDVDPRPRARRRRQRLRAAPGDPVPRLPPQRRGSASRRGGDAAVLLAGPVPQRDGRADRRVRLPEGLRRPLPQRRLRRRAPRHPGPRDRLAVAPGRRCRDAQDVRRRGEGRRQRLRLPRADRPLPHA